MTVDIRRKEPINFERQRLVRPNLDAPKPKFKKGFGGSIASMSKPEMYGRFHGISANRRNYRQVMVDVSFREVGSAYWISALSSNAVFVLTDWRDVRPRPAQW